MPNPLRFGVGMKFEGIDHVGVVVADLDRARRLLEEGFGMECVREIHKPELNAAFFNCGNANVELFEILDPGMRSRRLGSAREARVEHIAIAVDDLDGLLGLLGRLGIETTGPPEASPANTSVWTQAETSGGVMYQFLERPKPTA
jgi:catechol 2,3-dioxygenase-like lactoylglutathione lyase family enzyme